MTNVITLTEANFDEQVLASDVPVIGALPRRTTGRRGDWCATEARARAGAWAQRPGPDGGGRQLAAGLSVLLELEVWLEEGAQCIGSWPRSRPKPVVMTDPESSAPFRASDAERERAAGLLREAMTSGRLHVDELDDRMRLVVGAKTRAELERLVNDVLVPTDDRYPNCQRTCDGGTRRGAATGP
ncbi:MAG: DUF1707 domain-containing protein [Solirubrobacteraceae bacterium]